VFGNVITVLLFAMLIKPTVGGSMQTRTAAIVYAVLLFAFFAMFVGAAGGSVLGLLPICAVAGLTAWPFYKLIDEAENPMMIPVFGIGGGVAILVAMQVYMMIVSG
jgi:hypothetical protein